jgi:hypothetical protein
VTVTQLSSASPKAWYRRPTTWAVAGGVLLLGVILVASSARNRGFPAKEV